MTAITITVESDDIAYGVASEDVFDLIANLDSRMADSDFTLSVIRYLVEDMSMEIGVEKEEVLKMAFKEG